VAKNLHKYYVNKRLSGAKQLLKTLSEPPVKESVYTDTCIDAALIHGYFAVFHYVNELLEAYHREGIRSSAFSLQETIIKESAYVTELVEYKYLAQQKNSWLSLLLSYPSEMLQQGFVKEDHAHHTSHAHTHKTDVAQPVQLIMVNSDDDHTPDITPTIARWILDECTQLIQRQRDHLVEC
jgi:hypothetical protein